MASMDSATGGSAKSRVLLCIGFLGRVCDVLGVREMRGVANENDLRNDEV